MVIKLFGHPLSTCTKQVATVFHEKKVPFEFYAVDFAKAEHKSPEHKAKQPFGQIPYIDDEGFILYESRAICRYLEDKYPNQGTKLIPSDIRQRALFEQGASIETSNFDAKALPLVSETVFKAFHGQTPDPVKVEELKTALAAKLDVYDEILSKQKYIAGDNVTLADLFHLPFGSLLAPAGINLIQERPHVARWFNELQNRPSWQTIKDGVKSSA
ncbi:hypothetical protein AGABI1DRAFT_60571 [Agaricus bisporus var. burnettii JB137-S8]|uniref:glutathione transferase n=2 Tax=Agaricus bisporus var. burnettii TaxID=192524 RepID=K5XTL6_AGABU|nr:uncharacterized protein AGABI1DRAFT_60571 [Agaricus bisporus var. burnettii JB137-S8]EKM78390.1 hypothetical protein AGABI1DRAFT_60571 [Agaricus bisporus var. burnettii JB137-S8]KAF7762170.1 hypothetical protein Agabi119p4_8763 [Agaricus bisporus var. burnettii]